MLRVAHIVFALCLLCSQAECFDQFAEPIDESASYQTEVLLSSLDNPTGIVFRPSQVKPEPHELLFAESGAGRILRISTNKPEEIEEVVTGFSTDELGDAIRFRVGPLALGFITRTKLAVTTFGGTDGPGQIACYATRSGDAAITAKRTDHVVNSPDDSNSTSSGFAGFAISGRTSFVSSLGEDGIVSLFKCPVEANRLRDLQPLVELEQPGDQVSLVGLTIIPPPRPAFLVAGLMGSASKPRDSRLTYLVPATGEQALNLPTGLNDIVCLAYSPSGQLYATDFSWTDEQAGGVFRLDDARIEGKQTCRAVKIASIARPFGLAFAPNGSLFVTSFGTGVNEKQGELIRIRGNL